jgi:hypothetical protein
MRRRNIRDGVLPPDFSIKAHYTQALKVGDTVYVVEYDPYDMWCSDTFTESTVTDLNRHYIYTKDGRFCSFTGRGDMNTTDFKSKMFFRTLEDKAEFSYSILLKRKIRDLLTDINHLNTKSLSVLLIKIEQCLKNN